MAAIRRELAFTYAKVISVREVNIVKVLRLGSMKDKRSLNDNKYADIFLMLFISITVFLMLCSIIWVYHVRV